MHIFLTLLLLLLGTPAYATTISHGISMFDDLKYPADFTHFDYVNPDAPKGGSVVQYGLGSFDSLNAFILKGNPAVGATLMFDTLLATSKDELFSAYGLIAETIEYPDDRSWVIFNLRKEAKWHDGTSITAADVVFSFNTLKTKGNPAYRSYYRDVLKAEALGTRKVKFTFANNHNRELPLIIGQLPIISKAYYSKHDFEKSGLDIPLGSGPYVVTKIDPGRSLTLSRVKDYWAQDLAVNKGRYNFDTIRYDYYRDMTVAIEAFKAGKYDFRLENIAKVWATAYNIPALEKGLLVKEQIKHSLPQGMQGFIMNLRHPQFQDVRVRKALNYAFDFEWENKNLFYSAYTRLQSYFSNSEFAATGLPNKAEFELLAPFKDELPKELFTTVFKLPTTDGTGYGIRENLLTAKKLLQEAGWTLKNGILVNSASGQPFKLEFLIDEPVFERVLSPYIKNLEKLGIMATIRTIDNAQYIKRVQVFDYDMILETFSQSTSPGNEQLNYWHSSKADVQGSRNLIGLKNPVIDSLVEKILSAPDKESLVAATRSLDRVLLFGYYVVPNWYSQSFRVIHWNKFGKPARAPKYELGFDTWWVDKEKEAALAAARKK